MRIKLYNFDDTAVKWFQSYLSKRSYKVVARDTTSTPEIVKYGVPHFPLKEVEEKLEW